MNKTTSLRKVLAVAAVLAASLGATSCSETTSSSWTQWIVPILTELFGGGDYENTVYYNGKANMEAYAYNSANNTFDKDTRQAGTADCMVTFSYNDSICQIKASNLGVAGDQVKDLVFATYFDPSTHTISPNEDYLTGGSCTFNGKADTPIDAACFQGRILDHKLTLSTIYFVIGGRLFKGTFEGTEMAE